MKWFGAVVGWILLAALFPYGASAQSIQEHLMGCRAKPDAQDFDSCIERVILGMRMRKIEISEDQLSGEIDRYYGSMRCREKKDITAALVGEAEASRRVARCAITKGSGANQVSGEYAASGKKIARRDHGVSDTDAEVVRAKENIVGELINKYIDDPSLYRNELLTNRAYADAFSATLNAYVRRHASSFGQSSVDSLANSVFGCGHCDRRAFARAMMGLDGFGDALRADNIGGIAQSREYRYALVTTGLNWNWDIDGPGRRATLTLNADSFSKRFHWSISCHPGRVSTYISTVSRLHGEDDVERERTTWLCELPVDASRQLRDADRTASKMGRISGTAYPQALSYDTVRDLHVIASREYERYPSGNNFASEETAKSSTAASQSDAAAKALGVSWVKSRGKDLDNRPIWEVLCTSGKGTTFRFNPKFGCITFEKSDFMLSCTEPSGTGKITDADSAAKLFCAGKI